jgi:hypothetical protein
MEKTNVLIGLLICILGIMASCDHGLQPTDKNESEVTGISGMITYRNWPPPDSLKDLRLVVFKYYPPDNILNEVFNGNAVVYPGLSESGLPTEGVESTTYVLPLEPGIYEYVVVAQQFGPNVLKDWQAAGHYQDASTDPNPKPVLITEGELLQHIDIHVDFKNLPLQPF